MVTNWCVLAILFLLPFWSFGQQYSFRKDTLKYSSFYAVLDGVFEQNAGNEILRYGHITEIYNSGTIKGEYFVTEGFKKYGSCFEYYENGELQEVINFYKDKRVDQYLEFHPNGKIACIGNYKSIVDDSTFVQYCDTINYTDSLTAEDFFIVTCMVKAVKNGEWKYFNDKGVLLRTELIRNDTIIETRRRN
jgi:antitoxin component YwqK of YwqJK toxin-antitoxin module